MKSTITLLLVLLGLQSTAQMNLTQLKAQLPVLKMPFDCPTDIPANNWGDEDLNVADFSYIKKDITSLYEASTYSSGENDRYLGLGYLSLGKATAIVYLWENVSIYDGMYRYSIRMDTYDEKGEFVDHAILYMNTWESLHDLDPNYEGDPENYSETIHGSLYTSKNAIYLKLNSEESVTRLIEITNGDEYDTENLELTRSVHFDLLEVLPSGKIQLMYNEDE